MLVAQSAKTFNSWKETSYEQRAQILQKVAALMREKEYLAKIITLEMGKLIAQAEGEILLSADILIIMPRTPRNF
jgi:succinate-semialdehyde dehydrogenase/glutarate-semialdehyde dehydrogenase